MKAKLQQIKQELRARMYQPVEATGKWLKRMVLGYYPRSCRAGESTAVRAFPLAVGSAVAVCTTPPESEVAGDLEAD